MRAVVVLLLLVGAGSAVHAVVGGPPPKALSANVGPVVELPEPPQPWTGGRTGCTVPDPSGTGGCVTGATAWLVEKLRSAVGTRPVTCWSEHAWNPASDHPAGRGCDVFFGAAGQFPEGEDLVDGWRTAQWLRVHAEALDVSYVIWQGRIWMADRAELGWAPYTGGGVYDPGDATGGHYDHVHVSLRG
ncbi:hypothetical protein ATJ97_2185 [Georgenia soli]|uniref:ARB-07466-like C-terminal domain-containing protein n=1 Tax=Georgenia soli TaxID=638953 RepID=A0A2A9EL38_9MICO|nr:hypothetical protein [Georgenia soli]PFG39674.1 hypothetical protein ATJ97_2185 [Georgenia soli]